MGLATDKHVLNVINVIDLFQLQCSCVNVLCMNVKYKNHLIKCIYFDFN